MIKGGLINPQLQRLGKISIGEKGEVRISAKGNKFQEPKKLDFFTVRTHYRTEKGQLAMDTDVMKRLGEKPRELKIRLPFNDLEKNFQCELRYYRGGMIYCSGDGEQGYRREEKTINGKAVYGDAKPFGPCGRACPDFQSRNCKRFGALRVILEEQQQVGGVYEYRTTSRHSIENILSGLMTVQLQSGGLLAWLPLTMKLVPQTVMTADNKATRAYIVQIVFPGTPQKLLETVRDILAIRAPLLSEIKALEAGMPMIHDDALEAKETQDEFWPEQSAAMVAQKNPDPGPNEVEDAPPTREELIRDIVATLQKHRPYTGAREGAYTAFIPADAMELLRTMFGVQKSSELKTTSFDALRHGYEELLTLLEPGDVEEDLEIIDAELLDDEPVEPSEEHLPDEDTHEIDETIGHEDAEDVPLTPGATPPDGTEAETSPSDAGGETLDLTVMTMDVERELKERGLVGDGEDFSPPNITTATVAPTDREPPWEALEGRAKAARLSTAMWKRLRQGSYAEAEARVAAMEPVPSAAPPESV